jgi:hypothetical protein
MAQVGILLRTALRMDFRYRSARQAGSGTLRPFLMGLGTSLFLGISLAAHVLGEDLPPALQATIAYGVAGLLLVLHLLTEYQEILVPPGDGDILYWRPIASRTLYAARVLHVLVYVTILAGAILLPASLGLTWRHEGRALAVFAAFIAGGLLNALFATGSVLFLHAVLLRRLAPERFHDALGSAQIVLVLVLVVGFQLLQPDTMRLGSGSTGAGPGWLLVMPATWFAALPHLAAEGWSVAPGLRLAGALAVLAAVALYGARQLAPTYQTSAEAVRVASTAEPRRRRAPDFTERLARRCVARRPLRLAGFDLCLALLRGDRRVRLQLMPVIVLPVGFTLAGLMLGRGADPYAEPVAALGDLGASAAGLDTRARVLLFWGVYSSAMMIFAVSRGLQRCHDWRAGWVFHAAPVERIDELQRGVAWAAFYGLLLPVQGALAAVLAVIWRDPLHVAAHLAAPAALAYLFLGFLHLGDQAPPFSREPVRHERHRDVMQSFLAMFPTAGLAFAHWLLRGRPLLLLGCGVLLLAMAWLVWWMASRRLRARFHRRVFEG